MLKFFPFVFKSSFRKKTRTTLTILAITLPLFVILLMITLLRTFDSDPSAEKGLFRLVVRHKVSLANTLPAAYGEKLKYLDGVENMTILNWFGGQYIDASPRNYFARFMVEPETFLKVFDEVKLVKGTPGDWIRDRSSTIVPEALFKKYDWRLGQKITLKGDIYPTDVNLTIIGVYKAPQEDAIYFHQKYIEESLPERAGEIMTFWLKTKSAEHIDLLTEKIQVMFENTPYPIIAESEKAFQNMFLSMLGNIKLLVASIGSITSIVILLIAANTMAMSARERISEIAILRVLGFQRASILWMLLLESLLVAMIGGLLGFASFSLILPWLSTYFASSPGPLQNWAPFMKIFPETIYMAVVITFFVGLFSGIVPAITASRRSILEGLRQV